MLPLSDLDIESELSYAYLHAVAARAGMACTITGRHEDNRGVDARIVAWFRDLPLREVDLKIQLKATVAQPVEKAGFLSFKLDKIRRYDDLRTEGVANPRILAVLFLPADSRNWLKHSAEELILRRCAYWVSLRGAPESANRDSVTVYIPSQQVLDPAGLDGLLRRIARMDVPRYEIP